MTDEDKDFCFMIIIPFGTFGVFLWCTLYFNGGC